MARFADHEVEYVRWQNRACRFYLAARLLHRNELYAPSAYSAAIAFELLLKATLIYWVRSFDPQAAGHAMAKLARTVKNKVPSAGGFSVPEYFYSEQRYLNVSRYPTGDKGLGIPSTYLDDLDSTFAGLVLLVPFQFNTQLRRALSGKDASALRSLRYKNKQLKILRQALSA